MTSGIPLYTFDPNKPDNKSYNGSWSVQDGLLTQSESGGNAISIMGDSAWTDYTLTLKARKTGGNEGFLILFHAKNDRELRWWNLGGWGNTASAIEIREPGYGGRMTPMTPFTVETGRWYDIRVEVKGRDIKCFVDDKLTVSATDTGVPPLAPIYATASRENATGDVIVKVVNTDSKEQPLHLVLKGAGKVSREARLIQMGAKPGDTNTMADPEAVKPIVSSIEKASGNFTQILPPYSISVLRLRTK